VTSAKSISSSRVTSRLDSRVGQYIARKRAFVSRVIFVQKRVAGIRLTTEEESKRKNLIPKRRDRAVLRSGDALFLRGDPPRRSEREK